MPEYGSQNVERYERKLLAMLLGLHRSNISNYCARTAIDGAYGLGKVALGWLLPPGQPASISNAAGPRLRGEHQAPAPPVRALGVR